jgi:hypothetical protein
MSKKIVIAFAATLVLGSASFAFANGSPDNLDTYLRNSGHPVYMDGSQFGESPFSGRAAFAAVNGRQIAQRDKLQFDRATPPSISNWW